MYFIPMGYFFGDGFFLEISSNITDTSLISVMWFGPLAKALLWYYSPVYSATLYEMPRHCSKQWKCNVNQIKQSFRFLSVSGLTQNV